jgi:hypothetical protein
MPGGTLQGVGQGRGVAAVSQVHLGRDHRAGVEIQRVLGLVGQVRPGECQEFCVRPVG